MDTFNERNSGSKNLIMAVYLPAALFVTCRGLLIPVLPLHILDFKVSYAVVGIILASESIGTLIGDIPAGKLLRYFDYKKCMFLGGVLSVASTLPLFWIDDLFSIISLRFASGMGVALLGTARHAYMAEIIVPERRGRSIAVLGGIGRLGAFVGPAIGGIWAAKFGLRSTFILFSVLTLVGILAVVFGVSDGRKPKQDSTLENVSFIHVLQQCRDVLLIGGFGQLCLQLLRSSRFTIITVYAADIIRIDVQEIGILISVASAIDMLMFYPAGEIMDRFGRKYAFIPSFILLSGGILCVPLTFDYWTLQWAAILIGLGNGLGSGTMMTLGADLAPTELRGEFLGFWRFLGDSGSAGGPAMVGVIGEHIGLVGASFGVAIFGLIGVVLLGFGLPETLKKNPI